MTRTRGMLVPSYMQQFNCIGSACEDNCCSGWRVAIDEVTYKKYNKVQSDLRPKLDKYFKRNRSSKSSEDYAKISLNSENSCPMLNDEKLCSIHIKLGESYLSNVCATYPKVSNFVNGILEKSATLSCPEVARLALLNPEKMEFDETIESVENRIALKKKLDTNSGEQKVQQLQQYFWELRIFSIQLLQNRDHSLADRLIILGMFYQKVEQYIQSGQIDEIPQLIASYTILAEGNGLADMLADIPVMTTIQMELLKNLIDTRVSRGVNQRYYDCFKEFLYGIQYTGNTSVEEISIRYQAAYNEYYLPFMREHEYILENYLVNYVYMYLFPLGNGINVFEEYIMLVIHYAMIKMHLIGIAGYHKEKFGVDHVIKLIQSLVKVIEHNILFLREVRELLRNNEYNSMAYMAILIKNN